MNPLDQLRDLHTPPPPGLWPPAPGWWLLSILALGLFLALVWYGLRRYRRNAYRRAALAALKEFRSQQTFDLTAALQLVRRTAITAVPDTPLATIPGPALGARLDHFCSGELCKTLAVEQSTLEHTLARHLYGPCQPLSQAQLDTLTAVTRRWIRRHSRRDLC